MSNNVVRPFLGLVLCNGAPKPSPLLLAVRINCNNACSVTIARHSPATSRRRSVALPGKTEPRQLPARTSTHPPPATAMLSLSLYASITCAALFRWIRVHLPSNRWMDGGLERMPGIIGFVWCERGLLPAGDTEKSCHSMALAIMRRSRNNIEC
jgi:hypothetical protein